MKSFKTFKSELLQNQKVATEYKKLAPKYKLIRKVIDKRLSLGLTQSELAKKIGTKQSAIARFESGNANPSLDFISKIAKALNATVEIRLVDM